MTGEVALSGPGADERRDHKVAGEARNRMQTSKRGALSAH